MKFCVCSFSQPTSISAFLFHWHPLVHLLRLLLWPLLYPLLPCPENLSSHTARQTLSLYRTKDDTAARRIIPTITTSCHSMQAGPYQGHCGIWRYCIPAQSLSCVWLSVTPWAVAHQAPLSMGFSRQEYWSGLPCPSLENLPHSGIEPTSPASPSLAHGFFTTSVTWEALYNRRLSDFSGWRSYYYSQLYILKWFLYWG